MLPQMSEKNSPQTPHLFSCLKLFGKKKEIKEDPETPIFFVNVWIFPNFLRILLETFNI